MEPLNDYQGLHSQALVVDSHNDTIVSLLRRGGQSLAGAQHPPRTQPESVIGYLRGPMDSASQPVQVDIPKLRAGGIDAAYFAVDVTRAWGNHLVYAMDGWGWFFQELEQHGEQIVLATTRRQIEDANALGKIAAVLTVENSEILEGGLNVLPVLYRLGVRAMTLTHSARARAGDGVAESLTGGGLSAFGCDLVRAMNEIGMMVDVSHISERGFWEVMELTAAPVLASHSCCKALCEQPRNLTDAQIKAMAEKGGVVGITFVPDFVDPRQPSIGRLLDHVEHAAAVGGIDCVGIGSDFDGGGDLLADATEYPLITKGLLERGWRQEDIRKVLGQNHLRLLQAVCG